MSATRSALPGETRAYADANKREQGRGIVVEAVERHPRRPGDPRPAAHSASNVDLP